jgi:hypothetical protein
VVAPWKIALMKKGVTVDGVRYKAMDVRLDQVTGKYIIISIDKKFFLYHAFDITLYNKDQRKACSGESW